jgi:alpha-glucoside transport system substrate-binding protein
VFGSDSFEQQIVVDAEAGSAPNIAVFPQPGLAADMAARGFLTPLPTAWPTGSAENYAAGQSWVDLGTYADADGNDKLYGFFYKVDVKSLVWYVPENFEDAGYEVPETMEELKALTEQIVADGETPWCIGLGSGGATGWPATDWVEDMMLRTQPPDVYDAWVTNEIPFTTRASSAPSRNSAGSPAMTSLSPAVPAPSPPPTSATAPRASSPPAAVLHAPPGLVHPGLLPRRHRGRRDATSSTSRPMPTRISASRFSAPARSGRSPTTARRAGLIEFLQTPIAHEVWMAQKGFLTPLQGVNTDVFADDDLRR